MNAILETLLRGNFRCGRMPLSRTCDMAGCSGMPARCHMLSGSLQKLRFFIAPQSKNLIIPPLLNN